jgi:hypothetical protein
VSAEVMTAAAMTTEVMPAAVVTSAMVSSAVVTAVSSRFGDRRHCQRRHQRHHEYEYAFHCGSLFVVFCRWGCGTCDARCAVTTISPKRLLTAAVPAPRA